MVKWEVFLQIVDRDSGNLYFCFCISNVGVVWVWGGGGGVMFFSHFMLFFIFLEKKILEYKIIISHLMFCMLEIL